MDAAALRVLLVEDSPSDAALLQESLVQSGQRKFDFTVVTCWREAVERLRQTEFDVMLLDLALPDVSGRHTLRRARAEAPHLPIVVLTGGANEALGLEAVRHGVQDYLIKGQAYGRQTGRAIQYAIERKRVEETLKQTEEALRERERQLQEANADLERRVAERTASLQETISDLEDFSHSITHDLRAPLRAIRAFAEILGEECGACTQPAAREHIQRITSAAERMDRLIQDVLQYSRLARSELPLMPVDLGPLLRGIIESYPAFNPREVEIRMVGTLPQVLGNEAALTQCFSNLLSNAVKFVAAGVRPQVRIWADGAAVTHHVSHLPQHATRNREASLAPGAPVAPQTSHPKVVRLWFADNGLGIPMEAQERVFALFQRLDRNYEGTGVGLTLVRKAVERMGGRVGLESEPGRGSKFWLELQAAGESEPGATEEEEHEA